jgi:hypothetical protein
MEARMTHPAFVVPGAMQALQALGKARQKGCAPSQILDLVHLLGDPKVPYNER